MARTVYKTKMDSFFTTPLALDELQFFPPLSVSVEETECGNLNLATFDSDDVYDVLKGNAETIEFSPKDLLDELQLQGKKGNVLLL